MADDGTKIYEPTPDGTNTVVANIDTHEVDYGSGDLRDRQRFLLAGQDPDTDVGVKDVRPDHDDFGLLIREIEGVPLADFDPNNTHSAPFAANEVFTGPWTEYGAWPGMNTLFLMDSQPVSVSIEWSADGVNKDTSVLGTTPVPILPGTSLLGTWSGTYVNNLPVHRYYRIKIVNGPTAGTSFGHVRMWRLRAPFGGTFSTLSSVPTNASVALLTRSVQSGSRPDGSFVNQSLGGVDPTNSSVVALGAGASFTGAWRDMSGFLGVAILGKSDVPGTLYIEHSADGVTVESTTAPLDLTAETSIVTTASPRGRFLRLRYVNGATPQTTFHLSALLSTTAFGSPVTPLHTLPTDDALAQTVRAIQAGKAPDGKYVSFPIGGHDPDNFISTLMAANEVFTGPYKSAQGLASMLVFGFSDQPLTTARIEWSDDGVNPAPGLITSSDLIGSVQVFDNPSVPGGKFYIYLSVITTIIAKQYRLKLVNGPTAMTLFNEFDVWTYDKPFTGSFGSLTQTLNNLSTALLTRAVQAGVDPNGVFKNVRAQGRHSENSSIVPLNGNTGGTDHIFRGKWMQWQDAPFVGMVVDMSTDQPGTLYVDLSELDLPVDGDESGVTMSVPVDYDPATTPLFRRTFPLQSRWVRIRYINGMTAQSRFGLDTAFLSTPNATPISPFGVIPTWQDMAAVTRSLLMAEDAANPMNAVHPTATTVGSKRGQDMNVLAFEKPVAVRALNEFVTGQGDVTDQNALPFPPTAFTDRAAVSFTNMNPRIPMFFSEDPNKLPAQGDVLFPYASKTLDLGPNETVYWRIEDQGVTATTTEINATTAQNEVGTTGGSARMSNDVRSILDAVTDSFELTGITASRTHDVVSAVMLVIEGRKASTPTFETVGYVDTVSGTAANVASVVSAPVVLNADHQYLVEITRRNAAAVVTSVVGMGTNWIQVLDVSGNGGDTRTSLWRPTSPPTIAGTVTANFSALGTTSVITVSRFSGVNLTTPLTNSETLPSTAGNTNTYADSISGVANGMAVTFAAGQQRTHTPGSGFTEQAEIRTGLTTNDSATAISTFPLTSGAAQAYSGTFSGNVGWAVIAVALQPRAAVNPVIRARYKVGAGAFGTTELIATLTNTADTTYTADITSDRDWTFADIDALTLFVDVVTIGAAPAELDRVGIRETDADQGNSARLAWSEIGGQS